MPTTPTIRVAILAGDQVIASSDDPTAVRVSAGMVASAPVDDEPAVLRPISEGRRRSCQMIALDAVPA
jgi:hypothetical protein